MSIADYFLGFEETQLPVLWHQTLLSFVEFYGANLNEMVKGALRGLVQTHPHHLISK